MNPVYADDLVDSVPDGWFIRPFEELVYFQEGPGIRNWQYVDEGVPFVNIRCLVDGRLDRHAMSHVAKDEALGKYRHFLLDVDDYVVSSSGTLGRIATVQQSDLPCMLNTSVIRMRPKTEQLDRGYLKYFLLSEYYQSQIRSFATGSAQLNYGPMHLRQMFIVCPPLCEQRAIAHILGTLDDKIELNRRMSETLEAMARALFKSWFVDFDPVRAKMEGRDPGLPKPLADLFPARLVDSELGEIPEGWITPPLADVLSESNERIGDFDAPEYSSTNDGLQLRAGRFTKILSASSAKNKLIRRGSLVFGLSRRILNFGLMRDEIGSVSSAYRVFKVHENVFFADLLERLMRLQSNHFYRAVSASSREGQSVSTGGLGLLKFVLPPRDMQDAFYRQDIPLAERIQAIEAESRTLAALRDALLPKLISGELRVQHAERIVRRNAV